MITQVFLVIVGFLGFAVTNGIFGSFTFYVNALICGALFMTLIANQQSKRYIFVLFGFLFALDMTSSNRPGLNLLFGACILALAYFLPQVFRFTTTTMQGIVGLFILLVLYAIIPFGFSGAWHRFFLLIPVFFILALGEGIFYRTTSHTLYEKA